MAKELWVNLPVKNIEKSKEFFTSLGFEIKGGPGNTANSAPLVVGKSIVMLFEEAMFKGFVKTDLANTDQFAEVLLSIDAAGKEEVDEMAAKAAAAGGRTSHKPHAMEGPMYGCLFSDPDGHRWNVLYMKS